LTLYERRIHGPTNGRFRHSQTLPVAAPTGSFVPKFVGSSRPEPVIFICNRKRSISPKRSVTLVEATDATRFYDHGRTSSVGGHGSYLELRRDAVAEFPPARKLNKPFSSCPPSPSLSVLFPVRRFSFYLTAWLEHRGAPLFPVPMLPEMSHFDSSAHLVG